MAQDGKSPRRRLLANLSLIIISGLIAIAGIEILVRIVYGDDIILFPRYHTDVTYGDFTIRRIRPDSVFRHTSVDGSWTFTTNKKGFRNYDDVDYAKPEGRLRVVAIGDSHTQGYEVRQDFTFAAVIERYLRKQGFDAEVLNTGVSGFGTAEELVLLENEIVKYEPDAVVLGFAANDFEDNMKSGLYGLDQAGHLVVQKREHVPGVRIQNMIYGFGLFEWLGENSYSYSMLFNGVWNFFKRRLAERQAERVFEYAVATETSFTEYQVSLMSALLQRMYQVCRENGIKLVVIDILRDLDDQRVIPSVAPEIEATIRANSDAYLDSRDILDDYAGVAELNVMHGHGHISEFAHTLYGVEAAKRIAALLSASPRESDQTPVPD